MSVFASSTFAQSPFSGFYGQISTGYESNQLTDLKSYSLEVPYDGKDASSNIGPQTFGGAPLMLGAGYYWQLHPTWLLGIGADYSAISQNGPSRQFDVINAPGSDLIPAGTTMVSSGASTQFSNRYNLFISPGYLIETDKLLYLKFGYSQVTQKEKRDTVITINANGKTTSIPTTTAGAIDTSTVGGYLLGLGYKQIISGGLYAFAEANYMAYGTVKQAYTSNGNSASKSGEGFSNDSVTNILSSQNVSTYQFLVGLGYAF